MASIKYVVDLDLNKQQLLRGVVQNSISAPPAPVVGQIYWSTTDDTLYGWEGSYWLDLGSQGSGSTNLTYVSNAAKGTITSSTGANADLPLATTTLAGLLSPTSLIKLNGLISNVSTNISEGTTTTTTVNVNSSDGSNGTLLGASGTRAGVLTSAKFNQIGQNTTDISNITSNTVTNITIAEAPTNVEVQSSDGSNDTIAAANGTNAGVMTTAMFDEHQVNNGKVSDVNHNTITNITEGSTTSTTVNVNSSDGANGTLAQASSSRAGVLSSAKFDEIVANSLKVSDVNHNTITNLTNSTTTTTVKVISSDGGDTVLPAVTTSKAGVATAADKVKIDGAVQESDTSTVNMSFVIDEDNMITNSATRIPTQQSVKAYVDNNLAANDAMVFKGTVGSGGTLTGAQFNALVVYNAGWTYKVITAGTYKGQVAEIGDQYMSTVDRSSGGVNADWSVIQTNIDGAVTGPTSSGANNIAIFNGTSGKIIKDSGVGISGSNTGDEPDASLTVRGIVELATITETNTGTDATRAVTPDGLDGWTGSARITTVGTIGSGTWAGNAISTAYIQNTTGTNSGDEVQATQTVKGIAEIATQAETDAGVDDTRIVTPKKLRSLLGETATLTSAVIYNRLITETTTSVVVTHAIGNQFVQVQVYEGADLVVCEVELTSATTVTLKFTTAPTANQYRVVIVG